MTGHEQVLDNYLLLAATAHQKRQLPGRDRFLMLAIETALKLGHLQIAEQCREVVVRDSPQHMLARHPDVATAARSDLFASLIKQLQRHCTPERAEQLAADVRPVSRNSASWKESVERSLTILTENASSK